MQLAEQRLEDGDIGDHADLDQPAPTQAEEVGEFAGRHVL